MSDYNAETIETLEYMEHIRKYCGMYIGSKDIRGLMHCVKELISNSIDEYLNGAGSRIYIQVNKDGSIYIEDDGRGIPHGKHSSGCSLLQACYGIANTGGKFNNATGESGYNTSGGEHGTGCKAVNALSTTLIATTARDGIKEIVEFSKGKFISYKTEKSKEHGVSVQFYPDGEIFETIKFDIDMLKTMLQEFSFLCTGLRFVLAFEGEPTGIEYFSTHGLEDYILYLNKNKTFLTNPIYLSGQDGTFQVEAIVGYNDSFTTVNRLYTNNIPQEKGTHLTGFKTAWTSTINTWAREKGILKEKDANFTGSDLEEGQILILNFKMIDPVFKGQNKEELSSSEGRTYVQRIISQALTEYLAYHEKDMKKLLEKAINARKAREAAKKARDAIRNKEKKKKKVLLADSKLADCYSKDRKKCEIYITEGDSASGNLKTARNNEFQAIMPVRGKILNVRKATLDKIQKNPEIMGMIEAFGLEVDPKTMKLTFDEHSLRYGKIIIESDADVDGAHIKNLFYTLIWTFCPKLIEEGYIYAGVPPLYRIALNKDEYVYLKDDAALEEYKSKHPNKKLNITRMKGLGEMDEDETTILVDPEQRIIQQVTVEDAKAADKLFDDLMGDAIAPRKVFIKEHSAEATYQV